jgi:hypothetical protein
LVFEAGNTRKIEKVIRGICNPQFWKAKIIKIPNFPVQR